MVRGERARDEWWRGAVIYHIYPRSFFDSNGDGIGDLPGIVEKLDYVASLGVDAVWLSPVFASPMCDFGYDVADYCAIDPSFGTIADFDRLLARAHALGLKLLIDQVWCHSSDRHPWFLASRSDRNDPKADWYVWADPKPDGTPPNNWLSVFGGSAWSWEPRRRQYYLHPFLASQPKLNLRNPAVTEALFETGRFWLDRGVDGFRLDAVDFMLHDLFLRDNPPAPPRAEGVPVPAKLFGMQHHVHDMLHPDIETLLQRIRGLMDRYPGRATLGEVSSQPGAFTRIAAYTAGRRLDMAYTLSPLRGGFDAPIFRGILGEVAAFGSAGGRCWSGLCWSFSNHDVERAASRWHPSRLAGGEADVRPDADFARLLMMLLLTLPGSICLYQGEELGLGEAEIPVEKLRDPFGIAYHPVFRGRDGSRTPIPWNSMQPYAGFTTGSASWLPLPEDHYPLAVANQAADEASLLNAWRRFIAWRRRQPVLRYGTLKLLDAPAPLLAFERELRGDTLAVFLNLGAAPLEFSVGPDLVPIADPIARQGLRFFVAAGTARLPRFGCLLAKRAAAPVGSPPRADPVSADPVRK
jgi:alpha-glucosidase